MSNLNANNVDVQRMINVFNELLKKMKLCSCLTLNTLEKALSKKEEFESKYGFKIFNLLENHKNHINLFKTKHLQYKELKKEIPKLDENNLYDADDVPQEEIKDKLNLEGIDEKTDQITIDLAKSTRQIYREILNKNDLVEYLCTLRSDGELLQFQEHLSIIINSFINKSKMTEEEEFSEKQLNAKLIKRIDEMNNEYIDLNNKLETLEKKKHSFVKFNESKITEIKRNKLDYIKETEEIFDKLERDIHDENEATKAKHESDMEYLNKKKNELIEENKYAKNGYTKIEGTQATNMKNEKKTLENNIDTYDMELNKAKENYIGHLAEEKEKIELINKLNKELMHVKDKVNILDKAHEEFEIKKKEFENNQKMLGFACGNIQSVFRGFFIRKTMTKKYRKILAGLKEGKPNLNPDGKKGGKDNKGKKK